MLQDTGYPLEVYLPPGDNEEENEDGATDWTRLKERWVGWGVEYVEGFATLMWDRLTVVCGVQSSGRTAVDQGDTESSGRRHGADGKLTSRQCLDAIKKPTSRHRQGKVAPARR